jgi:hypothetical protein
LSSKTGERAGSRPKPPEAVARPAPALRPLDRRAISAQLLLSGGTEQEVKVIWVKSKAEAEKAHLSGVSSNSNALNPMSTEYLKPFARYKQLHSSEGIVWNVFDRERVDPQKLTFDNHIEIVLRLMKEASASEKLISDIRNCLLDEPLRLPHSTSSAEEPSQTE